MALLIRWSLRLPLLAVVTTAALSFSGQAAGQQTIEKDVKAAYLYNFAKFVEWPEPANTSNRFQICVVGDPAFATALDGIINGETTGGRPFVRVEPASPGAARDCQILFIGGQARDQGTPLIDAVRRLPVLTVGEAPGFLEQGGTIRFVTEAGRVRFDISPAAADRAGLKISSKLLRVARSLWGAS
jgi:hypothetical protein